MKRKKKTASLLIGIVVLLALIAVLAVVQKKADAYENKDDSETLTDLTADEITGVGITKSGSDAMSFTLADDTWTCDQDDTLDIDSSQVNLLTASLTGITVTDTIDDVTDLSQYGLDEPNAVISITDQDGTETTISVGDTNSTASVAYVLLNDDTTTVYAVSTSITSHLDDTIDDYIAESTEEASSDAESAASSTEE